MADDIVELNVFHFDNDRLNFEDLSADNGFHFWLASKLMEVLGYSDIVNVKKCEKCQTYPACADSLQYVRNTNPREF